MKHLDTLQGIALMSGSFLSGAMMSISLITMPVLVKTPLSTAQLCSIWSQIYVRGRGLMPAIAVMASAMYGYAYARQQPQKSSKALLIAGGATIAIAPFTWIVLAPTNAELLALKAEQGAITVGLSGAEQAKDLIIQWSRLHIMRSLLPLFGAVTGLFCWASR